MATKIDIGFPPARTIEMVGADGNTDPDWEWDGHDWMVGLISSTPHKVLAVEWDRTIGANLVFPIGSPAGPFKGVYWDNTQKSWMRLDPPPARKGK